MFRYIIILILLLSCCIYAQENWSEPEMLDSPYWNDIAGLYGLFNPAIAADDSLVIFNHLSGGYSTNTAFSSFENNTWQEPYTFPYFTDDVFFHSGTDTIIYFSAMHSFGYGGTDLWSCIYQDGEWQPANNLGPVINSEADEHFPTMSAIGDKFCFLRGENIMCSAIIDGEFSDPIALPDYINTDLYESHPTIHPDGLRIYFNRASDPFGYNPNLIYVTYFQDGIWQQPVLLNDNINFYLYNDPYYGHSYQPTFSLNGTRMYFGHNEYTYIGEIMQSIWMSELISSVDEDVVSLPAGITVSAFPNPFNAETRIAISGDLRQVTEIAIYDITGALVRTLEIKSTVTWNGINAKGKEVASGLYFVRVAGNEFMEVEKLTLLR